ncbi:MAG: DUF4959 domain-containing protein [Odoribacteraceae bacterium]|jgi:hypothetical protein|nr:DUF4959 domain-containing protein [Odoribacteraceae bacterium]
MNKLILSLLLVLPLCAGCGDDPIGQPPTDSAAPDEITNVQTSSIPGGAIIRYTLPTNEDLLYVMAKYERDGAQRDVKSSLYANSLKIEGFGDTMTHPVQLVSVDRSGNASRPTDTRIKPLTPAIWDIVNSFSIVPDFGGIHLDWRNENRAEVSIYLMARDSTGELVDREVLYTSVQDGVYSLRGMDTLPRDFGVYVRDRWGNLSDTLVTRQTPIFEVELDRGAHRMFALPGDNTTDINAYGFTFLNMFDGVTDGDFNGWHSNNYITRPSYITIDLGMNAFLSRMKLWHRGGQYLYAHYNPSKWEIWGASDVSYAPTDPAYWAQGGAWETDGHWTLLQTYEVKKPSGKELTDVSTNEDLEFARAGFESKDLALPADPVRYVRVCFTETCSGSTEVHLAEIRFWGKVVN